MNAESKKRLFELFAAHAADSLTPEEHALLQETLRQDAEARRLWFVHQDVELGLHAHLSAESLVLPNVSAKPSRWLSWRPLAAAAAIVLFAGVTALLWQRPPRESSLADASELRANGYAVLVNQVDARWESRSLTDGALLPPGVVRMASGMAHIEMFSGVTLVVEGAAEFEVISPMELRLARGKLRAQVPEAAHGFRVRTAEGDVVDLGTEFALNVSAQQSEVHVLNGEVEWHPVREPMQLMKGGEALRVKAGGPREALAASAVDFAGLAELGRRDSAARSSRRAEWDQFAEAMRRDPRLLAYYRLATPDSARQVPNLTAGEGKPGSGAIVAAARVEDRWGSSNGALDFSPTGSRVRLNVPGGHASLTLMCWVKINSLDRMYNSLFLTDGHEVSEPHWQLLQDGRLFFSVKKRQASGSEKGEKAQHICHSPPFWNTALAGQWLMLATTYDVQAKVVTHFLNGEVLSREELPEEFVVEQVRIGAASIGNWSEPVYRADAQFAVRNLNGSMDEFALFAAALSAEEVKAIYTHGKP